MQIKIEYPIITTGKPARSSRRKTVVLKDVAVVDIPGYSRQGSRVAMVADGRLGLHGTEYFGFDGSLYTRTGYVLGDADHIRYRFGTAERHGPLVGHLNRDLLKIGQDLRRAHSKAIASVLYPSQLADYFARVLHPSQPTHAEIAAGADLPSIDLAEVSELDESDIARQRDRFLEHAARHVLMDGELLERTPDPVYVVKIGYDDGPAAVEVVIRKEGEPLHLTREHANAVAYFAADRYADAMAYAARIKAAQGGGNCEVTPPETRITVRDGGFVSFDDERESMLRIADNMAHSYLTETFGYHVSQSESIKVERVRSGLQDSPFEALVAWKRLTEAMGADDQEALPEAVRGCLEAGRRPAARNLFTPFGQPEAVILTALEKWENRAVSFGVDVPAVSPAPRYR